MVSGFKGILKKIYRRDAKTGFTVFGTDTDEIDVCRNDSGVVVCRGNVPPWPLETNLSLKGRWVKDENSIPGYEHYFFCVSEGEACTDSLKASKSLLKSVIKEAAEKDPEFKITQSEQKLILSVTGPDILSYVKSTKKDAFIKALPEIEPALLNVVYGALSLTSSYALIDYLSIYGGSVSDAAALLERYGLSAVTVLKRNPYRTGAAAGLDFFLCDRIGRALGKNGLGEDRIKMLLSETLSDILSSTGSTYTAKSAFISEYKKMNAKSSFPDVIIPEAYAANVLQRMDGVFIEKAPKGYRIYDSYLYADEKTAARHLKRLDTKEPVPEYRDSLIEETEKEFGIKYSEQQKEAFSLLKTKGVKIITGGPGTGKTTVMNGILSAYGKLHPYDRIALCAPTGRAAQKLSEVTGMEALTVHKVLDFKPYAGRGHLYKNAEDPIDADLIVVDEMSMVDTDLFAKLLPAVKNRATLILIGDENQLQSVSSGNVLHDIISTGLFEMYRFKKPFRQKSGSTVTDNAYRILNGERDFETDSSFQIVECENTKEGREKLKEEFLSLYKAGLLSHSLILSPLRKGKDGTRELNREFAKELDLDETSVFVYNGTVFHINDRIIFEKNNYKTGYYNGDMGKITAVLENGISVRIKKETLKVTGKDMNDVSLAYAITVHKSQGSEADRVVIYLPDTYRNTLNKNLLFTAVTRAKKSVTVISVKQAFLKAASTECKDNRKTGLAEKIKERYAKER